MEKIPWIHQKRILVDYLGIFAHAPPTKKEIEIFKVHFPSKSTYFVKGNDDILKKVACYYLLEWGKLNYRYITADGLIDLIFNKTGELADSGHPCNDRHSDLIILHSTEGTRPHKAIEPSFLSVIASRQNAYLPTLVLSSPRMHFPLIAQKCKPVILGNTGVAMSTSEPAPQNSRLGLRPASPTSEDII